VRGREILRSSLALGGIKKAGAATPRLWLP
jgi:hypothetical protein